MILFKWHICRMAIFLDNLLDLPIFIPLVAVGNPWMNFQEGAMLVAVPYCHPTAHPPPLSHLRLLPPNVFARLFHPFVDSISISRLYLLVAHFRSHVRNTDHPNA